MRKKSENTTKRIIAVLCVLIAAALIVTLSLSDTVNSAFDRLFESAGMADVASTLPDDGKLYVHFIDVGQGDCELITCGDNAVLIDAGEKENAERVRDYISELGYTSIDCVIMTHPHSDHAGGLPGVMESFRIDNILMPRLSDKNSPSTETYAAFIEAANSCGAKIYAAVPGDTYTYGKISFQVISPGKQYSELNDMSVVIRLTYGTTSFLFEGDAQSDAENDMLLSGFELNSDVLKVAHHGSSTSSVEEFVRAVSPKYAVISCGDDNSYNHPSPKTVALLEKLGISYFRTDFDSTVVFSTDGKNIYNTQGDK